MMRNNFTLGCILTLTGLVCLTSNSEAATTAPTNYATLNEDGWRAIYPQDWKYAPQKTPTGETIHIFMGIQQANYLPYCQVTKYPVNQNSFPEIFKMKPAQAREFILKNSDMELFSSIHSYVVTAPEFKMLRVSPGTLGKDKHAMSADFFYATAQGFHYRARSFFAFGKSNAFSVWCQATGRTKQAAEFGHHSSIAIFQKFFGDFEFR